MQPCERRIGIELARKYLRDRSRNAGRRNAGMHQSGQNHISEQISALDGICGGCHNLFVYGRNEQQGRYIMHLVYLRCQVNKSPVGLYANKSPGEKVECDKRDPPLNIGTNS